MEVNVLKKEGEKLEMEVNDLTFINVLHENLWKKKVDYSAFNKDHPYLTKPVLLVKAKDTKKALLDAAESVVDDTEELKKKFQKAMKG
ncbi:MAG: hypothetical protein HY831_03455 [Candidatus Aenigmarchaeota archaeon]|nr:hypothetical protein [Candidatus Aenigmarchaeota archaeon]